VGPQAGFIPAVTQACYFQAPAHVAEEQRGSAGEDACPHPRFFEPPADLREIFDRYAQII
jgi:hypothetical protein